MQEKYLGRIRTEMELSKIRSEKVTERTLWVTVLGGAFLGITRFLETHPEAVELIKKLAEPIR